MLSYIQQDWDSSPWRFLVEALGCCCNIGGSLILALTVQHPALVELYSCFLCGSFLLGVTSYSRGSTGLVALYSVFLLIDTVGLTQALMGRSVL
jgi:hypothetical protein